MTPKKCKQIKELCRRMIQSIEDMERFERQNDKSFDPTDVLDKVETPDLDKLDPQSKCDLDPITFGRWATEEFNNIANSYPFNGKSLK